MPNKDAVFMTKPINVLNERTLRGTFFGNYKPRSDLPSVVDMYMRRSQLSPRLKFSASSYVEIKFNSLNKFECCDAGNWRSSLLIGSHSPKSTRHLTIWREAKDCDAL